MARCQTLDTRTRASSWAEPILIARNKNAPFGHYREQEFDSYIQDTWRVSSRLTVNLGLRWEAHPGAHSDNQIDEAFDLKNDALVLPQSLSYYVQKGFATQAEVTNLQNLGVKFETPQQAGYPSNMIQNSLFNFNPRVGFAWTPGFADKWKTVVRGGYGEYIYPVPIRNSVRYESSNYPFTASYSQNYESSAQSPDGLPNYLLRAPLPVIAGLNSSNVVNTASTNALLPGITTDTVASNYPPAHVKEANMTIEQPFKDGSVFPYHLSV